MRVVERGPKTASLGAVFCRLFTGTPIHGVFRLRQNSEGTGRVEIVFFDLAVSIKGKISRLLIVQGSDKSGPEASCESAM